MRPLEVLEKAVGREVRVRVVDSGSYAGVLSGFDLYANVLMKNAVYTAPNNIEGQAIPDCIINGHTIAVIELA